MTDKKAPDWEAIEGAYRAGMLSIREIAKQHGVTDTAIRKRAKAGGWARDLTAKVREAVRAQLVRTEVRAQADSGEVRTKERDIVDQAAATAVAVVREHRRGIRRWQSIVDTLCEQLATATDHRDALEALIEMETTPTEEGTTARQLQALEAKRAAMLRAVGLGAHLAMAKDGALALGRLVELERRTFGLEEGPPPEPAKPQESTPDISEEIKVFKAKIAAMKEMEGE